MGLNRMMMKHSEILKDIEAEMVVGASGTWIGFMDIYSVGVVLPNPLPNGVYVTTCAVSSSNTIIQPYVIKSCTLKEIDVTITQGSSPLGIVGNYLSDNIGKTIPVIFHFD